MVMSGATGGKNRLTTMAMTRGKVIFFQFADLAQLRHPDLAFLLGRQQSHHRRLDHGHQGHIGVCGHRDRTE